MNNGILKSLQQNSDGVWVSESGSCHDQQLASELFLKLKNSEDLSSSCVELNALAENWEQELMLSPLRANLLRSFSWPKDTRVLEINSYGGALSRYLAEQGLSVDVLDVNYQSARMAAHRCGEFEKVNVINQSLSQIEFDGNNYDLILLVGATDRALEIMAQTDLSYQDALSMLIEKCYQLLSADGQLIIAADNRQGLKYLSGAVDERSRRRYYACYGYNKSDRLQALNISQWHNILDKSSFVNLGEYYPFPDYRFPRVLLNKDYVNKNAHAYQHLEGLNSRDYFYPLEIGIQEYILYEAGIANRNLGNVANSFLFILSKSSQTPIPALDFAHLPGFNRNKHYETIIKKFAGEDVIKRIRVFESKDDLTGDSLRQNLSDEAYIQGIQLSVIWQRSLFSDDTGRNLCQLLEEYFGFLGQLESGEIDGFNIDALPNNIIVDKRGEFHLFDREWESDVAIDREFIFYRALVIFVLKNANLLKFNPRTHNFEQLSDFIDYGFKCIGLNLTLQRLEALRLRDIAFQNQVSDKSTGYLLTDLLEPQVKELELFSNILWRAKGDDYTPDKQLFNHLITKDEFQSLRFKLPVLSHRIVSFRFTPFDFSVKKDTGFFGVNSISLNVTNPDKGDRVAWSVNSSDEVAQENIAQGVYYVPGENKHVFMFTSNSNFLEFNLPDYEFDSADQVYITVSYRIARSQDYQLAQKSVVSALRKAEGIINIKESQYLNVSTERDQLKSELKDIVSSRAWRLIQAYRDTFKISGYPIKSFFGKVVFFIRRFKRSK